MKDKNYNYIFVERKKRKNIIDKKIDKTLKIDKPFIESALKANNEKRKLHGMNPLQSDDYLNKRALILAKEFLINGEFDNKNLLYSNCEDLGLNLKMSNQKLNPEELIENWYKENRDYNYKEPNELECNNFTQMIWKNSTNFGIGYYHLEEKDKQIKNTNTNDANKIIEENIQEKYDFCYIALYYPAGNKIGEYKDNIIDNAKVNINYEDLLDEFEIFHTENKNKNQIVDINKIENEDFDKIKSSNGEDKQKQNQVYDINEI